MPYSTPLPDTLFADSTDLQGMDGVVFELGSLDGLLAPCTRRGSNIPLPGAQGVPRSPLPLDAFPFTLHVVVWPADETASLSVQRASTWDRYAALLTVLRGAAGDGLVTWTRRRSTSTGHVDEKALGEFSGAQNATWHDLVTLAVDLACLNTSGAWTAGDPTDPAVVWVLP